MFEAYQEVRHEILENTIINYGVICMNIRNDIMAKSLSPLGRSPHSQALILPLALSYSEIYSTC